MQSTVLRIVTGVACVCMPVYVCLQSHAWLAKSTAAQAPFLYEAGEVLHWRSMGFASEYSEFLAALPVVSELQLTMLLAAWLFGIVAIVGFVAWNGRRQPMTFALGR